MNFMSARVKIFFFTYDYVYNQFRITAGSVLKSFAFVSKLVTNSDFFLMSVIPMFSLIHTMYKISVKT